MDIVQRLESQSSKLIMRVRFPLSTPFKFFEKIFILVLWSNGYDVSLSRKRYEFNSRWDRHYDGLVKLGLTHIPFKDAFKGSNPLSITNLGD